MHIRIGGVFSRFACFLARFSGLCCSLHSERAFPKDGVQDMAITRFKALVYGMALVLGFP